jgi:O-antigen ligase
MTGSAFLVEPTVVDPRAEPGRRKQGERPSDLLANAIRLRGYEIPTLLAAVVIPINSEGAYSSVVSSGLKATLGVLALICVWARWLPVRRVTLRRADDPTRAFRRVRAVLVSYVGILLVLTLPEMIPGQRKLLALQLLVCVLVFIGLEHCRPGAFFGVTFWASTTHLALAVATGAASPWIQDEQRLSGGTHPILLGFEAAMLLVVAVWAMGSATGLRLVGWCSVVALSGWVLLGAFSRASLIAVALALLVVWVFRSGWWGVKLPFVVAGLMIAVIARGGDLVAYLSKDQIASFYSGTGRLEIWQQVWEKHQQFLMHGFGFGALNDSLGPDVSLWAATGGENAENAVLQVLLDGGLVLLLCWVVLAALVGWYGLRRVRPTSVAIALLLILLVSAVTSSGLSGEGFQWWWLLAFASLAHVSDLRERWSVGDPG